MVEQGRRIDGKFKYMAAVTIAALSTAGPIGGERPPVARIESEPRVVRQETLARLPNPKG